MLIKTKIAGNPGPSIGKETKGKIKDDLASLIKGEMQSSKNKTGKSLPPSEPVTLSENNQNILSLKIRIKPLNEILILKGAEVTHYFEALQSNLVLVLIHKASENVASFVTNVMLRFF